MTYLRLLFWLKWKLLWRGYRRNTSAVVGIIAAIILFLPVSLGVAIACGVGFHYLKPPNDEHLLRAVLLVIYLIWIFGPLLGYALSDTYDISKLLVFPLTARQIFTGAILGSVIDFPVLLLLPTLAASLIGFSHGALSALLVLLALALFLFHALSLSQALILVSAGVLRSRRFRDVAMVAVAFFWMSWYAASRMLVGQAKKLDWKSFLHGRTWEGINLLPSGLAARTAGAAEAGDYLASLGFLFVLLVISAGTVYLAGWLVEKVYAGEAVSPAIRKRRAPAPVAAGAPPGPATAGPAAAVAPRSSAAALSPLRLPPVVEAVADKEFKYIFREPYFKLALMNLVYMLFVAIFAFMGGRRSESYSGFRPGMIWGASGMVLLMEMSLLFNIFGTEGGAATVLFLFPGSRRQILLGKNLTLFVALSAVNLVFMAILAVLADALQMFGPLFCWMELAIVVFIAVGNLTSIWIPFRAVARGWRIQQQKASTGCGYGFLYMLVTGIAGGLLLPLLVAILLPTFWLEPVWFALTVPLSIAYAGGIYLASLWFAEPLLLRREREIIARVAQEE
jgi:ABC-2 type transport system permease protein